MITSAPAPATTPTTITAVDTQVFSAQLTADNTYQDLDLSAVVGSKTAFVLLAVNFTGGGGNDKYIMRRKGDTVDYSTGYSTEEVISGYGVSEHGAGKTYLFYVMTNSSGVIEHMAQDVSDAGAVTITVKGYIA